MENDLQLTGSYESSPPCNLKPYTTHTNSEPRSLTAPAQTRPKPKSLNLDPTPKPQNVCTYWSEQDDVDHSERLRELDQELRDLEAERDEEVSSLSIARCVYVCE